MARILGISGKKGSGKDTLADFFSDHCINDLKLRIEKISFASALKQTCGKLFGIKNENLYGTDEQKNEPTKYKWSDMPGYINEPTLFRFKELDIDIDKMGLFHKSDKNISSREFLQFFGTEICRKMNVNVHVESLFNSINCSNKDIFVVPDVRFSNEVRSIQNNGGVVVRLTRNPLNDCHESEKELDLFDGFDMIIDNSNMSIEQEFFMLKDFLTNKSWF